MNPAVHRSVLPVAAVALAIGLGSCHHPDSILLVEVAGDLNLMPASFVVTVTPGQMASKELRVMPAGGGIASLPASFSVELPGSVTGPVNVMVEALDVYSTIIATGSATQRDLNVGGQTILVVTIAAPGGITITQPDAGGSVDASDAGASDGAVSDAAVSDAATGADSGTGHGNGSGKP